MDKDTLYAAIDLMVGTLHHPTTRDVLLKQMGRRYALVVNARSMNEVERVAGIILGCRPHEVFMHSFDAFDYLHSRGYTERRPIPEASVEPKRKRRRYR